MTYPEAIIRRISNRKYVSRPLSEEEISELNKLIEQNNRAGGLRLRLVTECPEVFSGLKGYGMFSGVRNLILIAGPESDPDVEEKCGYYGEKVVLKAQQMGLNTCWVALTYKKVKSAFQVGPGEKLGLVIAVGYGKNQGVPHTSKAPEAVMETEGPAPDWFRRGVEAALLAPTAMNQQKFKFTLRGDTVAAKAGMGFYTKVDLGIVKYHFELGAGTDRFRWAE